MYKLQGCYPINMSSFNNYNCIEIDCILWLEIIENRSFCPFKLNFKCSFKTLAYYAFNELTYFFGIFNTFRKPNKVFSNVLIAV